jgi:hypothetical protein
VLDAVRRSDDNGSALCAPLYRQGGTQTKGSRKLRHRTLGAESHSLQMGERRSSRAASDLMRRVPVTVCRSRTRPRNRSPRWPCDTGSRDVATIFVRQRACDGSRPLEPGSELVGLLALLGQLHGVSSASRCSLTI